MLITASEVVDPITESDDNASRPIGSASAPSTVASHDFSSAFNEVISESVHDDPPLLSNSDGNASPDEPVVTVSATLRHSSMSNDERKRNIRWEHYKSSITPSTTG